MNVINQKLLQNKEDQRRQLTEVQVVMAQESPRLLKKGTLQGSTILENEDASSK
jgi:hypothetical protein